jgi:class 3 adenylate cyclase
MNQRRQASFVAAGVASLADRGNSDFALVKAILVVERSRKVPVPAVERKLAAIFAADIAGYSRLMGLDEAGTLAGLKARREIMDRLIAAQRGRIFNTAGDSVVADFVSAVDAVQCAVAVQEALAKENAGMAESEACGSASASMSAT